MSPRAPPTHPSPRSPPADDQLAIRDATDDFDCKVDGCERAARSNRGRHAYLCDTHARSAAPVAAPPLSPLTSFEAKAKSLVKVGRDLDKAIAGYKPAKSRLDDAMRAWRDAVAKVSGGDTQ
ncbi:MAG TPA: hypothetical protein VIL92_06185 [Gaiellaceae bacterium]